MPRPVAGYVRPESVECIVCGGPVEVAEKGRIPDGHPACITLSQDVTRVLASLADAVSTCCESGGMTLDEARKLRRSLWTARITGEANTIWNNIDNPAKRRKKNPRRRGR